MVFHPLVWRSSFVVVALSPWIALETYSFWACTHAGGVPTLLQMSFCPKSWFPKRSPNSWDSGLFFKECAHQSYRLRLSKLWISVQSFDPSKFYLLSYTRISHSLLLLNLCFTANPRTVGVSKNGQRQSPPSCPALGLSKSFPCPKTDVKCPALKKEHSRFGACFEPRDLGCSDRVLWACWLFRPRKAE